MTTQYILKNNDGIFYYKDREMRVLHREDGPAAEWANGSKYWYLNGTYHRVDGPAVEDIYSASKYWYLNGTYHRVDGPAIEYSNGDKYWYLNGKLHREDGPAVEYVYGSKLWYLNGNLYREEEHKKLTTKELINQVK